METLWAEDRRPRRGDVPTSSSKGVRQRRPAPAKRGPSPSRGQRAPIKFRNKKTGEAWSGRGLRPRWLVAALKSGRKLEDFAV